MSNFFGPGKNTLTAYNRPNHKLQTLIKSDLDSPKQKLSPLNYM